jgi:hypothetical protein
VDVCIQLWCESALAVRLRQRAETFGQAGGTVSGDRATTRVTQTRGTSRSARNATEGVPYSAMQIVGLKFRGVGGIWGAKVLKSSVK